MPDIFTSRYVLPSAPRANVPVVVFVMVLPGSVSVCVIVKVAWTGLPVTTLPPKPPTRPPNSIIPGMGPSGPGPRPPPNPPGGGGPCAATITAEPANSNAINPAPNIFLFTALPPQTIAQELSFAHKPNLLNQLHSTRPAILAHQNIRQN